MNFMSLIDKLIFRGYLIQFPAGTVEEVYAGQSTPRTFRTLIRFPGGQRLTKYVVLSCRPVYRSLTMLAFPTELLEGPAPPFNV